MQLTHAQHIVGPPSSCLERMSPTDVADKWFDPVLKSFRITPKVSAGIKERSFGPYLDVHGRRVVIDIRLLI